MDAPQAQLDRIEQLLREGNQLRQRTIALQQESIDLQREALAQTRPLLAAQQANLERADRVNDGALAIQQRARQFILLLVPILFLLIGYVSYLLFFRPYA